MAKTRPEGPGGTASSPPAFTHTPWSVVAVEETPSTQDLAVEAAQSNGRDHTAYIAGRQTSGRGRNGREWQAPKGNLNFSALLRPARLEPIPGRWALMAAVALHEAVAPGLPPSAPLLLKWPNDLLLDGKKLAGILIDSALTPAGQLDWVVIGIGVNLAEAPALPDRATTCLAAYGVRTTPAELASRLMAALDHWSGQALPAIRDAWLARAHPPGTPLRVHAGPAMIEGAFEGLAEDGSLLLHGHPPIRSAEVFLEAPDAAGR